MYYPNEMMEIFAICIVIAGLAYLCHVFTSMERTALRKPALESEPTHDLVDVCMVTSYPDAYVDPASYKRSLCTNTLPEGVIAFRMSDKNLPILRSWLADRCCGPCSEASDTERAEVAVKD